jgi:hypothetical protein
MDGEIAAREINAYAARRRLALKLWNQAVANNPPRLPESTRGLRHVRQGIDMRERPALATGSAEADEVIEGLVDEMQKWTQSGELTMMEGQEEWKKARNTQQGSPAAAVLQGTPRRQSASPLNTRGPSQGLTTADRSRVRAPSMASQQGQPSPGRRRSNTPGWVSEGGAAATPPPDPSPVRGRGNSQGTG